MKNKIKVAVYGCGPIGLKAAEIILEKNYLELIGAVDIDPKKKGQNFGSLIGNDRINFPVSDDPESLFKNSKPDVCVLTTSSSFIKIKPQLETIIKNKINVVSTCEELSFPWETNYSLAKEIDNLAKENSVSVLGTGVNPGFIMDFLPLASSAVCRNVKSVRIERIQNAAFRRLPFQMKIGAGLSIAEFNAKKKEGTLRHVGLTESIQMIASKFNWALDNTEDIIEPVIAETDTVSASMNIPKGNALGVLQTGRGFYNGEELITLIFKASIGEAEPRDRVIINGEPNVDLTISGGVHGDTATCSITVNAIRNVLNARPGLRTMADIEPVSFSS